MEPAVPAVAPLVIPAAEPNRASRALPCPCGRAHPLTECCLPVARRLRRAGGRPSPFDEIRATSALLLWGLLAGDQTRATRGALSAAARAFWGPLQAAGQPESAHTAPQDAAAHGLALFERTWGGSDAATRTWLYGTLPTLARADIVLGELALDWLLWDRPWLRDHPAAHWTARRGAMNARRRVRRTYDAILRSRIGLWHLEEVIPQRGFRLHDRLTGDRTLLHTDSDPWPDAPQRLLLARVYAFGDWRLIGGRCLLLDAQAVGKLLDALENRATTVSAPPPHDPRWRPWLKAELIPLIATSWASRRLAPPPPGRYHGTYC